MAKQFIQLANGKTKRVNNRFAGENRVGKGDDARKSMQRRQRLFDEAMLTDAFDHTGEPLEDACCITGEEPQGDSTQTCSDDGQLDVIIMYSPEGRVQAALCRPVRTRRV